MREHDTVGKLELLARDDDVQPLRQRTAADFFALPRLAAHHDRVAMELIARRRRDATKMLEVTSQLRPRQRVVLADPPLAIGGQDDIEAHGVTSLEGRRGKEATNAPHRDAGG